MGVALGKLLSRNLAADLELDVVVDILRRAYLVSNSLDTEPVLFLGLVLFLQLLGQMIQRQGCGLNEKLLLQRRHTSFSGATDIYLSDISHMVS